MIWIAVKYYVYNLHSYDMLIGSTTPRQKTLPTSWRVDSCGFYSNSNIVLLLPPQNRDHIYFEENMCWHMFRFKTKMSPHWWDACIWIRDSHYEDQGVLVPMLCMLTVIVNCPPTDVSGRWYSTVIVIRLLVNVFDTNKVQSHYSTIIC